MDKKTLIKIGVLFSVLLFLVQPFFFGGRPPVFLGGESGEPITAPISFSSRVVSYDPVILVEGNVSFSDNYVASSQFSGNVTIIRLTADADIKALYARLKEEGYKPVLVANVLLPEQVSQTFGVNRLNVSTTPLRRQGIVSLKFPTPYYLDTSTSLTFSAIGVSINNRLHGVSNLTLSAQEERRPALLKELLLLEAEHTFKIPWEKRNEVEVPEGAEYVRKDMVKFLVPLNAETLKRTASLPYIRSLSPEFALVDPNFTNSSQVVNDFGAVSFPPSLLKISSEEAPPLPYPKTSSYLYSLKVVDLSTGKEFETTYLSNKRLEANQTINATFLVSQGVPLELVSIEENPN